MRFIESIPQNHTVGIYEDRTPFCVAFHPTFAAISRDRYCELTRTGLGELLVCESGTNPSRLVDRTVELGLVSRTTPDAGDRRQVILQLTAKGRELEGAVGDRGGDVRGVGQHRDGCGACDCDRGARGGGCGVSGGEAIAVWVAREGAIGG